MSSPVVCTRWQVLKWWLSKIAFKKSFFMVLCFTVQQYFFAGIKMKWNEKFSVYFMKVMFDLFVSGWFLGYKMYINKFKSFECVSDGSLLLPDFCSENPTVVFNRHHVKWPHVKWPHLWKRVYFNSDHWKLIGLKKKQQQNILLSELSSRCQRVSASWWLLARLRRTNLVDGHVNTMADYWTFFSNQHRPEKMLLT